MKCRDYELPVEKVPTGRLKARSSLWDFDLLGDVGPGIIMPGYSRSVPPGQPKAFSDWSEMPFCGANPKKECIFPVRSYSQRQPKPIGTRKETRMAERIGFVGVGRMGANMARRLKDCGYPVVAVYDARPQAAEALAKELGAEACTRLARVTELSDVIFTVVTDDKAMGKVFIPPKTADSLLQNARGKLFINCATVSPKVHVQVEKLAKKAGADALDRRRRLIVPNRYWKS
jgi:hypothetical protein